MLDVETQYAKTGVEVATAYELGRLRVEAESGQQGISPEQASAVISRMVDELRQRGTDDDSQTEPVTQPADESTP